MNSRFLPFLLSLCVGALLIFSCERSGIKEHKIYLSDGWKIQQSTLVELSGKVLSGQPVELTGWYAANVPTTVMGALYDAGLYPDIMLGMNMKDIDKTPFDSSWWFVKEFDMDVNGDNHISLNFDGISYRANIWLNGEQVADAEEIAGPFRRFSLDVTPYIKKKNILAVEVFKAKDGEPNIGFVDWNPRPADESMGIFREVYVHITKAVSMNNTAVKTDVNTDTMNEAWIRVETELTNHSGEEVQGWLVGKIEDGIGFRHPVVLAPNEKKIVSVTHEDDVSLHVHNPRLWWCNNLGNPEVYRLDLHFEAGSISDKASIPFGIREIKDYFVKETNQRGFILNGQKVLVKSGGWTDDIFLRNTGEYDEIQVQYAKDMNLNAIRFENIWGKSQHLYDLCDRYGMMVLVGWSCHWEWEEYLKGPVDEFGGIITEEQMDLIARSFEDQVLWLRNHPSIIAWYVGSDMPPRPALEEKYLEILSRIDNRPYVASAANNLSRISGPVGMKMSGPYEYVGPNYWYEDRDYGGAWGFNTETGIGAQLPVMESIEKFIPGDKLWPVNEYWNYHCTASGNHMNNLNILTEVIDNKYGKADELDDYLMKAHALDYDGTKAMFEAFRANVPNTTGIVQWMMNSAWPSLYWQVYDYYLVPTAGYYGMKKANQPQQLVYDYAHRTVSAINEYIDRPLKGLMRIKQYDISTMNEVLSREVSVDVEPNSAQVVLPAITLNSASFIALELFDEEGKLLADNFYWVPAKNDVLDYNKTLWVYTPTKTYGDLKALNDLPGTKLNILIENGGQGELFVTLKNEDKRNITFFTQLLLKDEAGDVIIPMQWSDNYVSILPEGEKILKCTFNPGQVKDRKLKLHVKGWNTDEQVIIL